MYSEYERVKDHRSFGDRQTVFSGPLFTERYERIEPKQLITMTEEGFIVGGGGPRHDKPAEPVESAEPVAAAE